MFGPSSFYLFRCICWKAEYFFTFEPSSGNNSVASTILTPSILTKSPATLIILIFTEAQVKRKPYSMGIVIVNSKDRNIDIYLIS